MRLLSLFKDQQIHAVHPKPSDVLEKPMLIPAEFEFNSENKEFRIWFDQTERIHCVKIVIDKHQLNISLQKIYKFNILSPLIQLTKTVDASFIKYETNSEKIDLCLGLKLSIEEGLEKPVKATVTIEVYENYYAEEWKRLDELGLLKATSDQNAVRKDHLFDTEFIDSGKLLLNLHKLEKNFKGTREQLFPALPLRTHNLINEEIGDGISMYVHLMNRNHNVQKNLPNWLGQDIDELILLDWSSTQPVAELPGVFDDPRVRVVRVEGQTKFIRTMAQNLASQMSRNNKVMKVDSDVEFTRDFFGNHPLYKGIFWVGNWMQARDFNERHLHGETYYHLDDFFRVNGYDERIVAYGHDDTNLKDRMVLSGCERKVFSYDFLRHQAHDQALRSENQDMIHPMVRTYQNRFLTNHSELWSVYHPSTQYTTLSNPVKYVSFKVAAQAQPIDVAAYENEAIDLIASWYLQGDKLKVMSREEKVQKIWELQVE